MIDLIIIVIGLVVLIIGSYTDFKTREVPDWISYGLVIVGFSANLLFSLFYNDYSYIIKSVIGFCVFFVFAIIMFYGGQWGGGDSKVIMGLGSLIGIELGFFRDLWHNIMSLFSNNLLRPLESQFLISFLINILLIGAVYGLIWSLYLVVKNFKKFFKELRKIFNNDKTRKIQRNLLITLFVLLFLTLFFADLKLRLTLVGLILIMALTFYLWIFIKSVENVCMIKYVEPSRLTEGDWIAKDVKVDGEYICGPKDLGIDKKQIRKLVRFYKKGKIKKILIKEGIPFIPSFLLAFIVTIVYGNVLFLFI